MSYSRTKGYSTKPRVGCQIDWSHTLSRGLIARWLVNSGGGSRLIDISGRGMHGTLTNFNTAAAWKGSPRGGCLDFDGSDDAVSVSDTLFTSLQDFSVAALISPSSVSGFDTVFGAGNSGDQFLFGMSSGRTIMYSSLVSPAQQTGDSTAVAGPWIHIAVTRIGAQYTFYKNGVLDGVFTGGSAVITPATGRVIGRDSASSGSETFHGKLDDLALYSRGLHAKEIKELLTDPYGSILVPAYRRYFILGEGSASGTFTATQDGNTVSADGTFVVAGAVAVTQAGNTITAGGESTITGSASLNQNSQTLASAGSSPILADLTKIQADQTLSAVGTASAIGVAALTQVGNSVVSAAVSTVAGILSVTQPGNTVSVDGSSTVIGTLESTQAGDIVTAASGSGVNANASITQDGQTLEAVAVVPVVAAVDLAQSNNTISAAGTAVLIADLAITQGGNTLVAAGSLDVIGAFAQVQAGNVISSTAETTVIGSLTKTQDDASLVADGTVAYQEITGDLTVVQQGNTVVSVGSTDIVGTLNVTEAGNTLSSINTGAISVTLDITQAGNTLRSVETEKISGHRLVISEPEARVTVRGRYNRVRAD